MKEIHFFTGKDDGENFFKRMAENNEEELTSNFIFEGNSEKRYEWIENLVSVVGWENIGVEERDYERKNVEFVDTIFINVNEFSERDANSPYIDIGGDEVSLSADGIIIIWWD